MYLENQTNTSFAAAYADGAPLQMHIEYVTNPYGRQPPHMLVFQDGRMEEMQPLARAVGGVRVELLGSPGQEPTPTQLQSLRQFVEIAQARAGGQLQVSGHTHLLKPAAPAMPHPSEIRFRMSKVDDIFELLGVPPDRRQPLKAGSLFNTVSVASGAATLTQFGAEFPRTREMTTLVVVPSHDPFKPEPTDAKAFELATLRQLDQRNGLPDFRAHYLIAKNGTLLKGRDLEQLGSAVPGFATGAVQVVVAGNGKAPTPEQRRMILEFGALARKHYAPQNLKAVTRDIVFAKELLGVDGTGCMNEEYVRADAVNADLPAPRQPVKR
jgi:hypothetical protein